MSSAPPISRQSVDASPLRLSRKTLICGVVLNVAGVALQIPDVVDMIRRTRAAHAISAAMAAGTAGDMDRGSTTHSMLMTSPTMLLGMVLLLMGCALAATALFRGRPTGRAAQGMTIDVIQHGRLRPAYWLTCAALVVALVIDIMKPLTIGFVMPGMSEEYGIPLPRMAILPIIALTGTAVGSVIWGLLADRFGRRAALLMATTMFVGTSACGAMPSLSWNVAMCAVMGLSAGGMLPLVFSLLAELTPARHSGWMAVMVGGIGGLGGYLAASYAAHYLEPTYTWRALWLIGLPTGLMLLLLSPALPESPLYLLRTGRRQLAEKILARYGASVGPGTGQLGADADVAGREGADDRLTKPSGRSSLVVMVRTHPAATAVLAMVGLVWGLVNFGFLVMLPAELRSTGMSSSLASAFLAKSTLYSTPAIAVVALLYLRCGGLRTLVLSVVTIALGLAGIGVWSRGDHHSPALLIGAIGCLILSLAVVNALFLPLAAEIYPTVVRATGLGLASAATKVGGVLGPSAMALFLSMGTGIGTPAAILAVVSLIAAGVLVVLGHARRARASAVSVG